VSGGKKRTVEDVIAAYISGEIPKRRKPNARTFYSGTGKRPQRAGSAATPQSLGHTTAGALSPTRGDRYRRARAHAETLAKRNARHDITPEAPDKT